MTPEAAAEAIRRAEAELERTIAHQRGKVLAVARRLNPRITGDDVLQPHDFPELRDHWEFQYEDGILAGLLSAQVLIRAALRQDSPREGGGIESAPRLG